MPTRFRTPRISPVPRVSTAWPRPYRLLSLVLGGLLLTAFDCAVLLHGPGHAYGTAARAVSGPAPHHPSDHRDAHDPDADHAHDAVGAERAGPDPAEPARPGDSCSPPGPAAVPQSRPLSPVPGPAAPAALPAVTAETAPGGTALWPAPPEARRTLSGRSTLRVVCRWRI
ncbi:hypothetical protein DMH02_003845 [Streptomyces sp. WAC 00631]|uniref:hypothetical protein n=1 Tax=Streptomyces sp. WAC 00631 TaxID=2203201 RepID=UPI000F7830AD|nr:hypothetical protein [Streptomyces sp. WAC 00631]MCC5032405.1 hypothetical protein [Streptomyces sp. WAC 00631]